MSQRPVGAPEPVSAEIVAPVLEEGGVDPDEEDDGDAGEVGGAIRVGANIAEAWDSRSSTAPLMLSAA